MGSDLYGALADAKMQGTQDGDYISAGQRGSIVIHAVKDISKGLKKTVILIGEILESHPKEAGAFLQKPGTPIKKLYPLTKWDWVIDELKTDLVNITGADAKTMSPEDLKLMFKGVFEDKMLRGVVANFDAKLVKREGKPDLTKVSFSEPAGPMTASGEPDEGHVNSEKNIAERAARLPKE